MGLDFSHGGVHFSYEGFARFRIQLAAAAGIELLAMEGHGGSLLWSGVSDPVATFLRPRDVDLEIPPEMCVAVADRLLEIVTSNSAPPLGWGGADWSALELALGMKQAAAERRSFRAVG